MTLSSRARRLRVLLITEGTYPYHFGGVSTWCDSLVRGLPDVDFALMSLISGPGLVPLYTPPPNVVERRIVPMWGVLAARETQPRFGFADLSRRARTSDSAVVRDLVPALTEFLSDVWLGSGDPWPLASSLHRLYRFGLEYDLDAALRSLPVWKCFARTAAEYFPRVAREHGYPTATFQLSDLSGGAQWVRHLLFPIARRLPHADIAHAAMAGACSLVALCAKLEHGAAFLLTEHGVYLREAYLAGAAASDSLFTKLLQLRFARRITEVTYVLADQISPCCDYNKRWELRLGADPERLKTIYYGVDSTAFKPSDEAPRARPTNVVWVGRINPLKDLKTLISAAAVVKASRPDVRFLLYGSAAAEDTEYHQDVLNLRTQLGVEDVVEFRGYIARPVEAYNQGDLVVLSSVSEAFPFSVLEAMLCARPIVATAVGGVPEEIAGCGIAVEPRNPQAIADAILELLNDPARCTALGRAARVKAVEQFSLEACCATHRETYAGLATLAAEKQPDVRTVQCKDLPEQSIAWSW